MNKTSSLLAALTLALGTAWSSAQILSPLTSFGNGDGWLAPGEDGYAYLGTGNSERGLAYGNGHLYLVSRSGGNFIRILDPMTGADLGALDTTGISGGTFAVNTIAVGTDGAIYVNNLTIESATSPLKVYQWATESSTPTVVYSGDGVLSGTRLGDSLAAIGGGSSTRLALGFGSSPVVAGNNGYLIIDPTTASATAVGFAGTPPAAGDFRLGITFTDSSHVLGSQGSGLYQYTSFSDATGILLDTVPFPDPAGATADRLMAYAEVGGIPLLAVQSTGDSHVSLYDITDPANPLWLASGNNTGGSPAANPNATGQLVWGNISGNTAQLWAMSSNQGIQAFTVAIPEPATATLLGLGITALIALRRTRH